MTSSVSETVRKNNEQGRHVTLQNVWCIAQAYRQYFDSGNKHLEFLLEESLFANLTNTITNVLPRAYMPWI